ncbi:MAG: hypothetical protein PHY15_08390 [Eubacteriales bacterium]|nr:hypothetical protein [Eubacteriales bacterium]MDD4476029.1 hypothetical protein [Eubacteriales bacterium]
MVNKFSLLLLILILCFSLVSCDFGGNQNESSIAPAESSDVSSEVSTDTRPALEWPSDNAFVANLIPFTGGKIVDVTPKATSVVITIVEVEESAFGLYINTLKQLSYTDVIFENETTYSAFKTDSPSSKSEGVTISYNRSTSTMTIDSSVETN